jgi:hypothetical protein
LAQFAWNMKSSFKHKQWQKTSEEFL